VSWVQLDKKYDSDVKNGINVNPSSDFQISSINKLVNDEMSEFDFPDLICLGDANLDSNVGREANVPSIPMGWNYSSDDPINRSGNCNVTINQFRG